MESFPRNTRRRVPRALALLCTLALATIPAVSPAQADDLRDKKHKVQQGIKSAQSSLEDSSGDLIAATKRLASARVRLADAERRLAVTQGELTAARVLDQQMQVKLVQAEQALLRAQQDVANGVAAVKEQRADIGRIAASSYQYGDPNLMGLSAVLNSQSPKELATQTNTVDNLMDRETTMLDRLKATEALLKVQRKKLADAEAVVAAERKAAAANLVRRQALEQAAAADRAQVVRMVSTRARAAAQARHLRQRDLVTLRRFKTMETRIERQILARARHQKGGGYSGGTGGFLYRPVPGPITSPYGWRIHPIYGYWGLHDGTDFAAPCGQPMHAGASGRVVSEYYSSVWGNRLYLDVGRVNGKSMILVYNHISAYRLHTGARVGRGGVVAYAGTTGWSTGCHLHFTVLINGKPVDPMTYM